MESDLRQTEEYGIFMEKIGWQVENNCFIKKFKRLPLGFLKLQRAEWPIDFERIQKTAKKNQVKLIKIEPNLTEKAKWEKAEEVFLKRGYQKDKWPMLPTKTAWLKLNKTEEELLNQMHSKTRYNIKKYTDKTPVKILKGSQINQQALKNFYQVYQRNCKRQSFWGVNFKQLNSLIRSFWDKAFLLTAAEGGLLVLVGGKTMYYSHNGVDKQGRKNFLPTRLTWEAIKLAKKMSLNKFDFEGIEDKRYKMTKKWRGFSRFKKSFGGQTVEYVGCFKKWLF